MPKPSPDLTPEIAAQLQGYRDQIDAIDVQLVTLLKQRIEVVSKVGAMKRTQTNLRSFIRSGREADMIRHFYREFSGSKFSPVAAASIWRHIIAASTHHEAPLMLSVAAADAHTDNPLEWLARDYFGNFIESICHQSSAAVMADLAADRANIAILPALQADIARADPWWSHLLGPEDAAPRIFACLPFLLKPGEAPRALAAAYLVPEETGDDITLLALEEAEEVSLPAIRQWFHDRQITCFHSIKANHAGNRYILMEIDGYFPANHPDIAELALAMKDRIRHITWLGSYAKPILIEK